MFRKLNIKVVEKHPLKLKTLKLTNHLHTYNQITKFIDSFIQVLKTKFKFSYNLIKSLEQPIKKTQCYI